MNKIINRNCLELMREMPDYSLDIIYGDPPYGLGSKIAIIDGKPDYAKAADFMDKWEMPDGEFWEEWFTEAFRLLKYGGRVILFGMPRQDLLFKYFAILAGFTITEPIFWYFISSFPKSSDLSKNIDKYFGREFPMAELVSENLSMSGGNYKRNAPLAPLAKKYDGYRYSVAPLKQCVEEVMIFIKPYKTGSCLRDTLAYENGDETCCCGAVNIGENRVGISKSGARSSNKDGIAKRKIVFGLNEFNGTVFSGRYPAQTFVDETVSGIIDKQSGISKSDNCNGTTPCRMGTTSTFGGNSDKKFRRDDTGGASKILYTCAYEREEYDLYLYCPKVNPAERDAGCGGFEARNNMRVNAPRLNEEEKFNTKSGNFHPTLKPISLNRRILKLFKTPNPQAIFYPFAGSGSEIIGGIKAGFKEWTACEINPEYIEIAEARIKYWSERNFAKKSKKQTETNLSMF